jgi:hypothetical protein
MAAPGDAHTYLEGPRGGTSSGGGDTNVSCQGRGHMGASSYRSGQRKRHQRESATTDLVKIFIEPVM